MPKLVEHQATVYQKITRLKANWEGTSRSKICCHRMNIGTLMLRLVFIAFLLGGPFAGAAQLESMHWYFNHGGGIDFWSGTAQANADVNDSSTYFALPNGHQYSSDALATVSNGINGQLLFYASNNGVFNRLHRSMPHGLPLIEASVWSDSTNHSVSAFDGALIVPKPGSGHEYYFFYLRTPHWLFSDGYQSGLFANLVNMEEDGGLGDVDADYRNVFLLDSVDESMTAVAHGNGVDYWLVVRKSTTNHYYAYQITPAGIMPPVVSAIGVIQSFASGSTIKFNHRGNKMAAIRTASSAELYDFDNQTGVLTNLKTVTGLIAIFGVEFSPDDSKMYLGSAPYQIDLSDENEAAMQASLLALDSPGTPYCSGLQLGLDGKIYGHITGSTTDTASTKYMAVIHNPNAAGTACGYQDSALTIPAYRTNITTPQFITSSFLPNFFADSVCAGVPAAFGINLSLIDSVNWNFGDPASGTSNTSTLMAPVHTFATAGSYTVRLIAHNGVATDTVTKTVVVGAPPVFSLGPDTAVCAATSDTVSYAIGNAAGTYLWHNGATTATLSLPYGPATGTTTVWLRHTNACGTATDTALLHHHGPLSAALPPDTALCADSLLLNPALAGALSSTLWSNGQTTATTVVPRPGPNFEQLTLWLQATNACGNAADTITVAFKPLPDALLPQDSTHCSDLGFYLLNPQRTEVNYQWNNGTTGPQLKVDTTGTYWLTSHTECDTVSDTFSVVFNGQPTAHLGADTFLCPGDSLMLWPQREQALNADQRLNQHYHWSHGPNTDTVWVSDTGTYVLRATLRQCATTDSLLVHLHATCYDGCKPQIANVITPNADGLNDLFGPVLQCPTTAYALEISNRWGQRVFATTNPWQRWDGTALGRPVKNGIYYYHLRFEHQGRQRTFSGHVQVMR